MMKPSWRLAAVCIVSSVAALAAQQTSPQTEFRVERPVTTAGAGPRRLAIDVPLLSGGRPFQGMPRPGGGLSDLRFFDASGREVPYLLVSNPPEEPVWKTAPTLPIAPTETDAQKTSGYEVDLGEALTIDRFRVDEMTPPFLKRVRLEGSGDRAHWTLLVAEGTVFDLPDEQLRQTELPFTSGAFRYVRLTWDDTRSGRLPRPALASVRRVRVVMTPPALITPLVFERRASEPGRSHFRVRLPGARLPIVALDVDVGGSHLLREASVFEGRLVGGEMLPTRLGGGTLKRVVQGDLTAASLRVPIEAPVESQIDLVIDDGNNPPLEVRGVTAVFAQLPWIYFESTGDSVVARYGHPSLQSPRYDLEAVRPSLKIDATMNASWGEARLRPPSEVTATAAPPLPTSGAALDAGLFKYVRPITPGTAGLIAVALDPPVLAHSQGSPFPDVRVIDAGGRQVPYLVERASEPLAIDLPLEKLSTRPPALQADRMLTVYRVKWPLERLPMPRLVLMTTARVFRRQVSVAIEHQPDRNRRDPWLQTLALSEWGHADQESAAPALTLPLPGFDAKELLLIVDEGDNSPLPLGPARVLLPSYKLRLFREQGTELRLAYGRDDLSVPRYDLALLAPQLIGVAATDVALGAEQAPSAPSTSVLMSPRVFWGVLIAAVLILLALLVRLVRKSDVESPAT